MNSKETLEIEKSGFISTRVRETLDSFGGRVIGILGWVAAISAGAAVGTYSNEVSEVVSRIIDGVTLSSSGDFIESFNAIKDSWTTLSTGSIDSIEIGQLKKIFSFLNPIAAIGANLAGFKILVLLISMYTSYKLISFPGKTLVSWILLGNRARSEHKVRILLSNFFHGNEPNPVTIPSGSSGEETTTPQTTPPPTTSPIPSPTPVPPIVAPPPVVPPIVSSGGGSEIAKRRGIRR